MTRQTDTDWITEGARVAELSINYSGGNNVRFATIDRVTKTQIVLDNDRRYRLADLRPVGEKNSGWGGRRELRRADDPDVRDAVANQALSNMLHRIHEMGRKRSLRSTRADVLAAMDEIAAEVANARRVTEGK